MDPLLKGTVVEGDPVLHGGKEQTVRFIDYERPENNGFLVINQFRVDQLPEEEQFLRRAYELRKTIEELGFAVVISPGNSRRNPDPKEWKEWTEKHQTDQIAVFPSRPEKRDLLAFLIVNNMLLTGFDAPIEQVLYLDRMLKGHDLLQAGHRPGEPHVSWETCGFVVNYLGVGHHLKEALRVYSDDDVQGALTNRRDEQPTLRDRHRRVWTSSGFAECNRQPVLLDCDFLMRNELILHSAPSDSNDVFKPRSVLKSSNSILEHPAGV